MNIRYLSFVSAALALALAACDDATPTAPASPPPGAPAEAVAELRCTVTVAAGSITCGTPSSGARGDIYLGGQGVRVKLTSSGVAYDSASSTLQAGVTVQNLLSQALGTPDGSTVTGVKVFFQQLPSVTGGTGSVTVQNADGTGVFTASNQPYFLYNQIVQPNAVSAAKTWKFTMPSTVTAFTFSVYVAAKLPMENGVLRWAVARTASHPGKLTGVWGTSENSIYVVSDSGMVQRWNGSTWTTLLDTTGIVLARVTGTSDNDVWVGAKHLDSGRYDVLHWNGSSWSSTLQPEVWWRSFLGIVTDLIAFSPTDVVAVAYEARGVTTVLHWDGTSWSEVGPSDAAGISVWGVSYNDLWLGSGRIVHKQGSTWTTVYSELSERTWNAIWGSSSTDVWFTANDGEIKHYNGTTLTSVTPPGPYSTDGDPSATYSDFWGTAANDVYVVGRGAAQGGVLGHWNGTAWSPTLATPTALNEIWGTPGGKYFAVGYRGSVYSNATGSWQALNDGGGSLRSVAVASSTNAYAVGERGLVLRWDGAQWTDVSPAGTGELYGVAYDGAANWYAVGYGRVLTWTSGGAITQQNVGISTPYDLRGVSAAGGSAWAVAASGDILYSTGGTFASTGHASSQGLRGVWASSPTDVFVVGQGGRIEHYAGGDPVNWTVQASGTTQPLYAVAGSGPGDVWAVGEVGTVLHYNGTAWSAVASGTSATLRSVWVAADGKVYAAGTGVLMQYSNGAWQQYSGISGTLTGLGGLSGNDVYAVGTRGQILHGLR